MNASALGRSTLLSSCLFCVPVSLSRSTVQFCTPASSTYVHVSLSRLFGNGVCKNATITQCNFTGCTYDWTTDVYTDLCPPTADQDFVEFCKSLALTKKPDGTLTGGTFLPSPPLFDSSTGTVEERCASSCASPFRAFLYFNTTAFRSFNAKRAKVVKDETIRELNLANIPLDANQVRMACNSAFWIVPWTSTEAVLLYRSVDRSSLRAYTVRPQATSFFFFCKGSDTSVLLLSHRRSTS